MTNPEDYRLYEQRKADFETKMAAYQADLIKYRADLDEWNALPDSEKAMRHAEAEKESRAIWSLLLAVAISIGLYVFFKHHIEGNSFWYVWVFTSVVILIATLLLSRFLGPVARGAGYAIGAVLLAFMLIFLIGKMQAHKLTNHTDSIILLVSALLGFLVGLFKKASAAPKKPNPPRHPHPPM